ncbi:CBS domain containing membrane protein [Sphingobium chlorophenolicum L-1]|uniref:CBS domain containing membrane protein n=1 Tax=Sphingobium chlorophenolicum L-1 TaxID=690566 RepID=F6EYF9_SPHCR|nr:HPP family protein [Sphingobium chlorophenolicum]AEG48324.1 CBS domain containing membrane protein [Sphingobium chlorophenolicum L-1]
MSEQKNDVRLIWSRYYSAFIPAPAGPGFMDRLKAASGAIGGIAITGLLCGLMLGNGIAHPLLIAPMGASAVLLFAVPASPLAQPWSVVGGNVVSALAGIGVANLVPDQTVAAALAVGCAIGAMSLFRCLHPPGGAIALSTVLGAAHGPPAYMFAFVPIGMNTALLVIVAIIFHRIAGHNYPHIVPRAPSAHDTSDPAPILRTPSEQDIEDALHAYGDALDVDAADLQVVLHEAEMRAAERAHGRLTCGEIMSRDVISVREGQPVAEARELLHLRRLLSLPVLDKAGRVQGVVGPLDLARQGERVRDIASEPYVVHADTPVAALLRPLTGGGRREAIVVDDDRMLRGLITQTDLLTAVARRA